ncbi:MAG: hypothetical protein Q8Q46_03855 [Candidatus Giovannonibacteria bacterium]|nr:hypothetical protein [Candidatus Giovannonibacteria bacterium]
MKKCVLTTKAEIDKTLSQKSVLGKHQLEPLKSLFLGGKIPFGIIEDYKISDTEAEVHKHEGDLWFCLEGEVEFIYGGELVEPWVREGSDGNELGGKGIKDGTKIILKKGDWLWIPHGQPHMHWAPKKARMAIIKIPKA